MASPDELRDRLQVLADYEDWDACLATFVELRQLGSLTADELVRLSAYIQLSSEDTPFTLESAGTALEDALKVARDYLPALIDLGWFHYAVMDDAKRGLEYFEKAEDLALGLLDEAVEGKKEFLDELAFLAAEEE